MKVLVCGGKHFSQRQVVYDTLSELHSRHPITLEMDSANASMERDKETQKFTAIGAEVFANEWCVANHVPCKTFVANRFKYGKLAEYIRNINMVKEQPDIVVSFPAFGDTEHMLRLVRENDIPMWAVDYEGNIKEIGFD